MTDDEYKAWRQDASRDKFRIVLIEIDHPAIPIYHPFIEVDYPASTIYLASRGWVSDTGQCYDDWILSLPEMETSIDSFGGLGGFEAKNADPSIRWEDISWHGQQCRWLHGDVTWARSSFRTVEVSAVDECTPEGGGVYGFTLLDAGRELDKYLVSESTTRDETVSEFVDWVAAELNVPISFVNIPDSKLTRQLRVSMAPYTVASTLLREVARDIGAEIRRGRDGVIELFRPSNTTTAISVGEIAVDRIAVIEVIRPFSRIEITMSDDRVIDEETDIDMGSLSNVQRITTHLKNEADVRTLLAELILKNALPRSIYNVPVVIFADTLNVGEKVLTDHPDLVRAGVISRTIRTPLSNASTLEIIA